MAIMQCNKDLVLTTKSSKVLLLGNFTERFNLVMMGATDDVMGLEALLMQKH